MKKINLFAALLLLSLGAGAQLQTNINLGWQFALNNDTANVPASWQDVDLPHDWSILKPPFQSAPSGNENGYFETGTAWYKKTLKATKLADGERLIMEFDGVYHHTTVFVNGQRAAWHGYGYTPFSVDITPYLDPNADNTVTVRVDNSNQKNSRWYSGSGIYRNVILRRLPAVSVTPKNVQIIASEDGKVTVNAIVENNSDQKRAVNVRVAVAGTEASKTVNIDAKSDAATVLELKIGNPKLWSTDSPNLYEAEFFIDNTLNLKQTFGFRTITYNAEKGFALNGQNMLLNGACVHHDNGLLGASSYYAAEYRKVKLMKDAGFNLIRTSHNPPSECFLDACDKLGMMVIDEAFDGWRTQKNTYDYSILFDSLATDDVKRMVMRDRNHPCIVAWSIGNEIIERKDIRCVYTARMLKKSILEVDNTRPVTEALCAWDRDWEIYDPHAEVLDIVGYNYMIFKHKTDHERAPKRVMWQTESYPRDAYRNYEIVANNPYVIGDMVWTGLDYLGESGIGGWRYKAWPQGESWQNPQWPWHGAYCGDVDITGFRKPISYYRDIIWNGSKASEKIHISACEPNGYVDSIKTTMWSTWPTWDSWNWDGWEGKPIDVEVYSAGKTVKLYLNDKLVGEKPVEKCMARFTLNYQPGTLKAESDGATSTLVTAGKPAKISAKADRKSYLKDGNDVAFIDITLTDKSGNPCAMSQDEITVDVKGGVLLALGTGDLRDCANTRDNTHNTWHGRAQAIIRIPNGAKGVTVTVKGKGMAAAVVKL
ncbi:MAG: DUF4982 domain-containing protein [Bacteroidales bacterium]|nr:DUF4982 domain-containing protein [Bacteroidales bacterium]